MNATDPRPSSSKPTRNPVPFILIPILLTLAVFALGFTEGEQHQQVREILAKTNLTSADLDEITRPRDIMPRATIAVRPAHVSDAGIVKITAYQIGRDRRTHLIDGTGTVVGYLPGAGRITGWALILTAHHVLNHDASIMVTSVLDAHPTDLGTPYGDTFARRTATAADAHALDVDELVDAALIAIPVEGDNARNFPPVAIGRPTTHQQDVTELGFHGTR